MVPATAVRLAWRAAGASGAPTPRFGRFGVLGNGQTAGRPGLGFEWLGVFEQLCVDGLVREGRLCCAGPRVMDAVRGDETESMAGLTDHA